MLMKNTVFNLFARFNIYPTTLVEVNKVKTLINKLRPISTDKKLIRLGPNGDGGYLVPNDLEGIEALYSPGVALVAGFEKDCADRGMKVFCADDSVEQLPEQHENIYFLKKYIGASTHKNFITLDDFVLSTIPDSDTDLMLQIDIEGFEFETFLSVSDKLLKRFRIIVVEFHSLHWLWSLPFHTIASRTFDKILQTHSVVHIHPNNTGFIVKNKGIEIHSLMEFTFLRNDRIKSREFSKYFPHPLDFDNEKSSSHTLPKCWYQK